MNSSQITVWVGKCACGGVSITDAKYPFVPCGDCDGRRITWVQVSMPWMELPAYVDQFRGGK
jgi:hypothetical protein